MHTTIKGVIISASLSIAISTGAGYWAMSSSLVEQKVLVEQLSKKVEANTETNKSLDSTLRSLELAMVRLSTVWELELDRRGIEYTNRSKNNRRAD